jgi:glycosyltransferase involved in cell wall biosynthesis
MKARQKYHVSLALLFYNEEANIVPVVDALKNALAAAQMNFELVLVDNGSRDRTPVLIRELIGNDSRLKQVTVKENLGYGWGAINGLNAAEGEWVGFMAGDGQVDPADVVRLVRETDSGYDLIKVRRSLRQDGFVRAWISNIYVMLVSLLFGLPFYDINATPRIMRRGWVDRLELSSRDWFLDAEMLIKARFLKLKVKEIPIIFRRREGGSSNVNLTTIFEFIKNIAKFRLGKELIRWKRRTRLKS